MQNVIYQTKQRDLIFEFIKDSHGIHFTADDIFAYFKSNNTNIGKSTI